MLRPSRSLGSSTNVIISPLGAPCASSSHILKTRTRIPLQLQLPTHVATRHLTSTTPTYSPTATPPRQVSVFLPHEDLKLKARVTKAQTAPSPSPSPSSPNTSASTSIIASHHDLPTYLRSHLTRLKSQPDAAKRAKLSASSVFLGTRYEYVIQRRLQRDLGFRLTRIGGKGDGGVDLIGTWSLPDHLGNVSGRVTNGETFKVLLQAKRLAAHRKPSPALMRELEGTLMGFSSSGPLQEAFAAHRIRVGSGRSRSRSSSSLSESSNASTAAPEPQPEANLTPPSNTSDQPTLGILVTTNPLTDGVEKAMASSRRCLMYMCLEEGLSTTTTGVPVATDDDSPSVSGLVPTTKLKQIAWNAAAAQAGLEGYDIVTKYSDATIEGVSGVTGEATFMYQGRPVQFPK